MGVKYTDGDVRIDGYVGSFHYDDSSEDTYDYKSYLYNNRFASYYCVNTGNGYGLEMPVEDDGGAVSIRYVTTTDGFDSATSYYYRLPLTDGTISLAEKMTQTQFNNATGGASASSSVNPIVDLIYPIGSVYVSINSSNPSLIFTGTTWQPLNSGSSVYLLNAATVPVYTNDSIVVSGAHTSLKFKNTDGSTPSSTSYVFGLYNSKELVVFNQQITAATRSGVYPYNLAVEAAAHGIAVYMWKRTA